MNSKRDKRIYWITTGLVCAVMFFSAINFSLEDPLGPDAGFPHLGLPNYFKYELTVAKLLGVLALLVPGVPARVLGFAYSGFGITLVSASIAHLSVGDAAMFVIDPLIFLALLLTSYVYGARLRAAGALPGSGVA